MSYASTVIHRALLKQVRSLIGTFHDDCDGAVVTAEYVSGQRAVIMLHTFSSIA